MTLPMCCSAANMATTVHQPPEHVAKGAHVDSLAKYKDMYAQSLKDPEVSLHTRQRSRGVLHSEGGIAHSTCSFCSLPAGLLGRLCRAVSLE